MSLQTFLNDVIVAEERLLPLLVIFAVIWVLWRCQATDKCTFVRENTDMDMAYSNTAFFDEEIDDVEEEQDEFYFYTPRGSVLVTIPEETPEELHLDQIGGNCFINRIVKRSTNEWLEKSFVYNDKALIGKCDLEWKTHVFDDLMAPPDATKRHRSRSLEDLVKNVNNEDKNLSAEAPPAFRELKIESKPAVSNNRKSRKIQRNLYREDFFTSSDEEDEPKNCGMTSKYVCQDLTQIDDIERESGRPPRENLSQDSGFCEVGQAEVNLLGTIGEECERRSSVDEEIIFKIQKSEIGKEMDGKRIAWTPETKTIMTFNELGDIEDSSWSGGLLQKEWEKSMESGRATTDDWLTLGPKPTQVKVIKNWRSLPCLKVPETKKESTLDNNINKNELKITDEVADIEKGVNDVKISDHEIEKEEKSSDKALDLRNIFAECRKRVQEGRDRVAKSVSNLTQVERCCREQLEFLMTSSKCQSVGYLETDLDTMQSHAVDETNIDQVMSSIQTASKTLSLMTLPRPRIQNEEKTRSMEFLMNEDNRKSVQPPENKLKEGQKSLSQHELRVRKSLQNLDIPEWLKKSAYTNGFLLKRKNVSYLGNFPSKLPVRSQTMYTKTVPSYCWRYANSVATSPTSPTKTEVPKIYLGWRSAEKINQKLPTFYQSPAERLASAPGYFTMRYGSYRKDLSNDVAKNYSRSNEVEKFSKPRRERVIWIESSFVGVNPATNNQGIQEVTSIV